MLRSLLFDIRYALRALARTPAASAVAIASLALTIGMSTAIYSLIDAVFMRSLPIYQPQRLVSVSPLDPLHPPKSSAYPDRVSPEIFEQLEKQQQVFSGLFGWQETLSEITTSAGLVKGEVLWVTSDFYSTLGVSTILGRPIGPGDEQTPVAVISYACWKNNYQGSTAILGQPVKVGSHPYTIVGVTPQDFFGLRVGISADVTIPFATVPSSRSSESLWLIARLKNDETLGNAAVQLDTIWRNILLATAPANMDSQTSQKFWRRRLQVLPATTGFALIRDRYATPLRILMGLVVVMLLVACSNLASLMLARIAARQHEFGVRLALGASRSRILRQILVEGLLLSITGSVLGLPLAFAGSSMLAGFVWTGAVPLTLNLRPDIRVLAFATIAALTTGVFVAAIAAWRAARRSPADALQQGSSIIGQDLRWIRTNRALILTQVALSLTLTIGAGLLIRSLAELRSVNPGFRESGVLVLWLSPVPGGYKDLDMATYYRDLISSVSAFPGVKSATLSQTSPTFNNLPKQPVWSISQKPETGQQFLADEHTVAPRFFETMSMSLLEGRDFTSADDARGAPVAILSSSLARELFVSGPAIGQWVRFGTSSDEKRLQVVGVVSDASLYNVRTREPYEIYLPFFQIPEEMSTPMLQIRFGTSDPLSFSVAAGREVQRHGHEYAWRTQTLAEQVDQSIVPERLLAMLSAVFGVMALLLTAIGVFGLFSYVVTLRTREIGVRIALGAERKSIFRLIMRESLSMTFGGVVVGLALALVAGRFIAHMLYDVRTSDPLTLFLATGVLFLVATLGSYLPASRASRIDSMAALRAE